MTLLITWFSFQANSDNGPLLYQIQQQEKRLVELSGTWGMKVNLTNGTGYPPEETCIPGGCVSTHDRPPSSVSSSLRADEDDYAGEIWEELDTIFRAQESHFVAQGDMSMSPVLGTPIPFHSLTEVIALHDTPGTPTLLQQQHLIVYLAASDHPPLPSPPHPISPLRLPKPWPKHRNTSCDTILWAQESHFVAQGDMNMSPVLGTPIPFDSPTATTALHDTPGTPTLLQQQYLIIYVAAFGHPLPSLPCLVSPLQFPKARPQHENTSWTLARPGVSSSCGAATSPPDGSRSARQKEVARVSPSKRYFACEDQINDLRKPKSWVHGAVINTLGDTFCYTTCSKLRHQHYDILPTHIYDLWQESIKSGTEKPGSILSYIKACTNPSGLRAWFVPILMEHHWYLLAFDWVDCKIRVYDSFSVIGPPLLPLIEFGLAFVCIVYEYFGLKAPNWEFLPEEVCGFFLASGFV